ncbi:MAG TPA: phosphate acyltransferase PlsX [Candidatus Acidoferrales bacterium]|nr:phosphate acyltransferase PlsX [Candidatus Acidoferrales bacterium]
MRIALDAMGGDEAPLRIVEGGLQALRESGNRFELVLVGRREEVQKEVSCHSPEGLNYSIVDAPEVIEMSEVPNIAIKQKRNSSIVVGLNLHKERKVDAFISAGNTGAFMAASTLILGRVEGVSRPAVGTPLPTVNDGTCFLIDSGANSDCRPQHIVEFGFMGAIYAREILKKENPTVALLNIGEESSKGNELALSSYPLLEKSELNFIGNVEGRDILAGKADVVLADGFVGNIVLKFAESILPTLRTRFRLYASGNIFRKLQAGSIAKTLRKVLKGFSYETLGGAPLLGVNGISIIGHGGSTALAVKNMVLRAEEMVDHKISRLIEDSIKKQK